MSGHPLAHLTPDQRAAVEALYDTPTKVARNRRLAALDDQQKLVALFMCAAVLDADDMDLVLDTAETLPE